MTHPHLHTDLDVPSAELPNNTDKMRRVIHLMYAAGVPKGTDSSAPTWWQSNFRIAPPFRRPPDRQLRPVEGESKDRSGDSITDSGSSSEIGSLPDGFLETVTGRD